MVFEVAYNPVGVFDRLKETNILKLAIILLVIRFPVTAITTVATMYAHKSPMAITPPFGLDEQSYRYYEIFWYGPYGIVMMLIITLAVFLIARRFYHDPNITFRKTLEIVSLSFFTPWLPSIPGDYLILVTVNAAPVFLIVFHISILVWECCLISLGFRRIFEIPLARCAILGLVVGTLFIAMGGLFMR